MMVVMGACSSAFLRALPVFHRDQYLVDDGTLVVEHMKDASTCGALVPAVPGLIPIGGKSQLSHRKAKKSHRRWGDMESAFKSGRQSIHRHHGNWTYKNPTDREKKKKR